MRQFRFLVLSKLELYCVHLSVECSGVTKVGVIRGATTDGITLFFSLKTDDLFSRLAKSDDDLFSYRLVTTPTLSLLQRLFSVKTFNFIRVSLPWMVSPGAVSPPP